MPFACKNSLCSSRAFNNCSRCHRTFFDKASLMQYSQQKRDTCGRCERSSTEFKPNWYFNSAQNNPKDLHHAACTGNFQLVAEFMRTEFSDQPGKSHLSRSKLQYGYTPIHCATFGGHYDCLKLMLSHPDGKPNIIDPEDGRTPVHLACWKGHADCLKLLLSKGGNLYLRDHNRDTPISLARDYACLSIILLHLADYLATSEEASQKPVLNAMELVWIRLRNEYGVIPDLESCDFEEIDKAPLVCYAEIPEPEEARNLQSKGKIPEEHSLECLPKVEESLDSWLHFEEFFEVVLKCRERADFPACVQKDKLKQMIDVDETFEGMLDFYHNRGLIILPGKLITAENQSSEINDLVVVKPQYLVDLITSLNKEPNLLVFAQRYQLLSKKLQDKCITDIERERICRDLASPVSEIVRSLEEFDLLCPISKLLQVTEPKSHGEGHDIETGIGKGECLKRKWKKLCEENWRGICDSDKVLVFDFYRPLPPSLFQYFIDRIAVESKRSYGMRPIKAKEMAIFSFGDSFFFLAETCPKFNQINISVRYKNGKKLHELFTTLMTIMSEICQHQFGSLKFGFGPICPIKQCPGLSYHGKDLQSNSSSEVSDGELDGNSTCDDWADDSLVLGGREVRPHVICIDPAESSRPLWCNSTPIHEFEAIKEWLITPQDSEGSPCYSISRCCQIFLAKTAKDWKFLGRYLGVNDKVIDNICTENDSEDERAYQVLRSWLHLKPGHEATVQMLMKALEENGDVKTKEAFERHLSEHN